jgi:hypothetical protein
MVWLLLRARARCSADRLPRSGRGCRPWCGRRVWCGCRRGNRRGRRFLCGYGYGGRRGYCALCGCRRGDRRGCRSLRGRRCGDRRGCRSLRGRRRGGRRGCCALCGRRRGNRRGRRSLRGRRRGGRRGCRSLCRYVLALWRRVLCACRGAERQNDDRSDHQVVAERAKHAFLPFSSKWSRPLTCSFNPMRLEATYDRPFCRNRPQT